VNAYDQLGGLLYTTPETLSVSPRRRIFGSNSFAIGAGATVSNILRVVFPDTLPGPDSTIGWQRGNGLLVEYVGLELSPNVAGGLSVQGIGTWIGTFTTTLQPFGQATLTTLTFNGSAQTAIIYGQPQLILYEDTLFDVIAGSAAGFSPFPSTAGINLTISLGINNSGAGSVTLTVKCTINYRYLRGLTEG
jgi:hypothetical protein